MPRSVKIPREVKEWFESLNWDNAEWSVMTHRGVKWRARRCNGAAHSNPFIDNCSVCAPLWGIVIERVGVKYRECPHCEANFQLEEGAPMPPHKWRHGHCPGSES